MTVKVRPLPEQSKFQGILDYPIEKRVDDWGLTPEDQESYVEAFRRRLETEGLYKRDTHDYYTLRRFLRARAYDIERATSMFKDHIHWRAKHQVDALLQDFVFEERDQFLMAFPQGYHKLDKQGRPIYIQLIGQVDLHKIEAATSSDRMFKFHVQEYERCVKVIMPVASHLSKHKIDQTFGIMDVRGVGMSHLTREVREILTRFTKTDQDNYPEMLGHICIINAPILFQVVWKFVKGLIDARTQQKIEILGSNYMDALLKHIDINNIPKFLGGKSDGTLFDDVGPWSDPELLKREGLDLETLRHGHGHRPGIGAAASAASPSGSQVTVHMDAHGRSSAGSHAPPPEPLLPAASSGRRSRDVVAIATGADGSTFLTPQASLGLGSRPGSLTVATSGGSARLEGPNGVVTVTSIDVAVGASSGQAPAHTRAVPPAAGTAGHLAAIAEARTRSLLDRIRAVEALLPVQSPTAGIPESASTRSTSNGGLISRVEVIEEALDTMLRAQEVVLRDTQEALKAAELRERNMQQQMQEIQGALRAAGERERTMQRELEAGRAKQGCCSIM